MQKLIPIFPRRDFDLEQDALRECALAMGL